MTRLMISLVFCCSVLHLIVASNSRGAITSISSRVLPFLQKAEQCEIANGEEEEEEMTPATLTGLWQLNERRSDSFAPFLEAAGAPAFVARRLARALNKDILDFTHTKSKVSVFYRRGKSVLPFKMQTDVDYIFGKVTTIKTPFGDQEGKIIKSGPNLVLLERHHPGRGEKIVDMFEALKDELLYLTVHHARDGKQTRVKRVFSRIQ